MTIRRIGSAEELKKGRIEDIYEYMLERADPKTGRVAIAGSAIGKELGMSAGSARRYLKEMCNKGKLVQLSVMKKGTATLYRLPAMCKGDVVTHYEADQKVTPTANKPDPAVTVENERKKEHEERMAKQNEAVAKAKALAEANLQMGRPISLLDSIPPVKRADDLELAVGVAERVLHSSDRLVAEVFHAYLSTRSALEDLVREVKKNG